MRRARYTKRFRKEYAKLQRSGKKVEKLRTVLAMLIDGTVLPTKHRDHELKGAWQGIRDCHIEGDWILLYELGIDENGEETITFHATDNHENLFG